MEQSSKRRKTESGRDAPGDDLGKDRLDVDEPENVLDTTAATADMTMTQSDEEAAAEEQQGTTTSSTAQPTMRELHQARRNRIRLHYSSGSYHASPSAWMAYTLCSQLRFGNVSDLLWLACVGVTDAYIHGRLDVSGYSALCVDLKRHVGRLFPNEMVDRVGRAVYAEELEDFSYTNNQADAAGGGGMTQIGLSENGRILSQSEYKFMLLRHTSLWDSLLHSNFVASKLQLWRTEGRQKLMELLAKMGFPLESCRQPWAFVSVGLRRRLRERIDECAEVRILLFSSHYGTCFGMKLTFLLMIRTMDLAMFRTQDSSVSQVINPSSQQVIWYMQSRLSLNARLQPWMARQRMTMMNS